MTDEQFLAGMWHKAKAMQTAEEELARAAQRNRRIKRAERRTKALLVLCIVAALAATVWFAGSGIQAHVLIAAVLAAMVAAVYFDGRSFDSTIAEDREVPTYGT